LRRDVGEPATEGESARGFSAVRDHRAPILVAVMMSIALVALDGTVIATAVPSVVRDLGGFSQFPWLFSIYLLTQAVTLPVYAKLSDQFGRKPVMLVGIGVFLLGSLLCGLAWTLPTLIAFRAVQGLGAGAVQPMAMTIIGDLYSVAERAKVIGYVAGVWAVSSVVGPTLGGVLTQYGSWRWIFLINIPVGVLAVWLLRRFRERMQRARPRVDYAGAALLAAGCSLVIVALLEGGVAWDWASAAGILVPFAGIALLVGFAFVERRAAEPILAGWVFRKRVLVGANVAALAVGAMLLALSSYVPTFAQTVLGAEPLTAGFAVAALTLGWPISATLSGRIYLRIGFRRTALIGSAFGMTGALLMTQLDAASSLWQVGASCFVIGVALGLVSSPLLVAVQTSVGWQQRGVATGTNLFARSIGSAVGVAAFGAVANATLAHHEDAAAVATASHHVFVSLLVVAAIMAVGALIVPRRIGAAARESRDSNQDREPVASTPVRPMST
jgi:EmrB/QacA subfamily drug resistance transporter